jgi:hypothetical protein
MTFLRQLLGYTKLDHQRNVNIRERLKVQNIVKEIQTYHKNWKEHVERMQDGRFPKLALRSNQWENEVEVVPKTDGRSGSWKS